MGMAVESQFHVLAVDDSLFDRKFIERLLQKSSCQVTTVDSGSKALEFLGLREVEVNLIITDYCMPSMTGYDLLKKLKESSAYKNIPVVIMSSENVPTRISRCLEEGAEEFFLKPVRLCDLNKLKTKFKNKKVEEIEKPSKKDEHGTIGAVVAEVDRETKDSKETNIEISPLQQEEHTVSSTKNNKRKSMEEGISIDRSRPRFDGISITTAV